MYPPFPNEDAYLQLLTQKTYYGLNRENLRETFYPLESCVAQGVFTMPASLWTPPAGSQAPTISQSQANQNGEYYSDAGDLTMPPSKREPRYLGETFKITQRCEGKRIAVRIEINTGWGGAFVFIDGVRPSQIPGVVNPCNYVTCDSDFYRHYDGAKTIEIVLAENLQDGTHVVELYAANGMGSGKFFVYHGMKGRFFKANVQSFDVNRTIQTIPGNSGKLTLANFSKWRIENITLDVKPRMFDAKGRRFFDNKETIVAIESGQERDIGYTVDGRDVPDGESIDLSVILGADYQDPEGSIVRDKNTTLNADSIGITYVGGDVNWLKDNETPALNVRSYNATANAEFTFETNATEIVFTIQKEYGYGGADVYVGPTKVATLSCDDPDGGGFLEDYRVLTGLSGWGVVRVVALSATAPFSFVSVRWSSQIRYTRVVEEIPIVAHPNHVKPYPIASAAIVNGEVQFAKPLKNASNWATPVTNRNMKEVRTLARFPTYCVYYGSGHEEILSEYDLLVIEPSAVSYKQVKKWKDAGIKVYGYVSFGEEDGDRVNHYDLSDARQGPHIDNGLGPGGYASYYCKGGNEFGESSECAHDKQRLFGQKQCAQSNPKYFSGVGRCSPACKWDTRDGGIAQQNGDPCPKGYTKATHYQRDAMTACRTSACPQYSPINNGCTQWTEAEVHWGQDFSIATPNFPDQNGIWASTFVNPIDPRWKEKISTFYFRTVFGLPQQYVQTMTLAAHTMVDGSTGYGFRLPNYPIDDVEPFSVKSVDGTYTFEANTEFSYDATTGVIMFSIPDPLAEPVPLRPEITAGLQVVVTYSRKGLDCDGVFMDTVDTADVYPSSEFQTAFINMINELKAENPTRMFCSNRGFSILAGIIKSCHHVMFESFLCDYDWATDEYSWIDEPATVEWNNGIKAQLRELRKTHTFDVLALNYCHNGDAGNELRDKVYDACYREGYMCWTSTILLNSPEKLRIQRSNHGGRIQSSAWSAVRKDKSVAS